MTILPISVVIPTLNRSERLSRTLRSLLDQSVTPAEVIIVDASPDLFCVESLAEHPLFGHVEIDIHRAEIKGAAVQRNQAISKVTQDYVLFADDDVDIEPECLKRLWSSMMADETVGAVGVVFTNQSYHPPGRLFRRLLTILGCPAEHSLAGRFCGPALNFLPSEGQKPVPTEWLNLCLTLVRSEALPSPPLLPFFQGYSLLEDAALTSHISKTWKLVSTPTARAYHDMKPADYKSRVVARSEMEVVNRWFVMSRVLDRSSPGWNLRLVVYQVMMLILTLRSSVGWRNVIPSIFGMIKGYWRIVFHRRKWQGYPTTNPL